MKVCSKWVCLEVFWVDFECFYAFLWRSTWLLNVFVLVTFDLFWPLLTFLWPYLGRYGAISGPFRDQNRPFWGDVEAFFFGPFLGRSGVIWGSLRNHFGIVLASFSGRFGVVLRPFWGFFWTYFGPFLRSFCDRLVMFWEVECNIQKNDAIEGKNMQLSAKVHRKYAKLCKSKPFFRL